MGNPIKHADSNKGNISGVSGVALSGFRAIDCHHGYEPGTYVYEDFHTFGAEGQTGDAGTIVAAGDDGVVSGYHFLADSSTTVARHAEVGGVVRLTAGATDDYAELKTGAGVAPYLSIPAASSDRKRWFFEAKVRMSDVSETSFFIGVKEPSLGGAAASTQTVADADNTLTAGQSLIGFWLKTNDDLVGICSNAGTATSSSSLATLADDTWVKLTVVYNEGPADSGQLVFAIDGEPKLTYNDITGSASAVLSNIDTAVNYMGVVAFKSESGSVTCDIDHVAYGSES